MKNEKLILDFEIFLKNEKNYSKNTYNSYILDIKDFINFTNKNIDNINENDINNYISKKIKVLSDKSINRKISSIRMLYKYLSTYLNYDNVAEDIKSIKRKKQLPKYLTNEEIDKLFDINLNTKYDYRNKAILELLYSSGLRASELINLDTTNIDFDNKVINVYGKGKKERIVPLSEIAIKYLKKYIYEYRVKFFVKGKPITDALFLNNHGTRITRNALNLILKNLSKEKKIDKEITPHVLRHSFATHLISNGADIRTVQEILGHENVSTTEIYTHLTNETIKKNYDKYFSRR